MHENSRKSHVLTVEEIKCLSSPIRHEIYQRFRAIQPASVADVAQALGRSVELVHYHSRELLKHGLIVEIDKRPSGRRPEAVYKASHGPVQLPEPGPDANDAVREMVVGGLKLTARQYDRAARASTTDKTIRERMHVLKAIIKLKNEDYKEFIGMLEAVSEFIKERQSSEGESVTWSSVVYPNVSAQRKKKLSSKY